MRDYRFTLPECSPHLTERYCELESVVTSLNRYYENAVWRSYGSEVRASGLLQTVSLHDERIATHPRISYRAPSLATFQERLCSEPVLVERWEQFLDWQVNPEWAIEMGSKLLGEVAQFRNNEIVKPRMGHVAGWKYINVENSRLWHPELKNVRARRSFPPLLEAVILYAVFVIFHPLKEGNGRVARAIFHGNLANRGVISAPFLPLGPMIYHYGNSFTPAFRGMAQDGRWEEFLQFMLDLIELCCQFTALERGISEL